MRVTLGGGRGNGVRTNTRDDKGVTAKKGVGFLVALVLMILASAALSGNALAATGVQCMQTGMETVTTDQESYPPGASVFISGGGYAIACDVELRITRPD